MFNWLVNNMRRGFATNSSSSHSLVYFKNEVASTDTSPYTETEFGWGDFTLASTGSKLMYALVALVGNEGYWNDDNPDKARMISDSYDKFGHLFPEFDIEAFELAYTGYIDHQSTPRVNAEFLELARDPHVVFYGGNDNDGTNVTDIVHSIGDSAKWGASMSQFDQPESAEDLEAEWIESQHWRSRR